MSLTIHCQSRFHCDARGCTIEVNPTDIIKDIKPIIQDKKSHPPHAYVLMFKNGKILDESKTFNDIGINNVDRVYRLYWLFCSTTVYINIYYGCLVLELMYKIQEMQTKQIKSILNNQTDKLWFKDKLIEWKPENMILYIEDKDNNKKQIKLNPFKTLREQNCSVAKYDANVHAKFINNDNHKTDIDVNERINKLKNELNGVKLSSTPKIDIDYLSIKQKQQIIDDWQDDKLLKISKLEWMIDYELNVNKYNNKQWTPYFLKYYKIDLQKKRINFKCFTF